MVYECCNDVILWLFPQFNFKFVSPQVDGEVQQKGSTKDMIFKIPYLISHISSIMTLLEGDVILTGIAGLFHKFNFLKPTPVSVKI